MIIVSSLNVDFMQNANNLLIPVTHKPHFKAFPPTKTFSHDHILTCYSSPLNY